MNVRVNITKLRIPTGGRHTSWLFTIASLAQLGATENNISQRSEWDLNPQPMNFKANALTTWPHYLPQICDKQHCRELILTVSPSVSSSTINFIVFGPSGVQFRVQVILKLDKQKEADMKLSARIHVLLQLYMYNTSFNY